MAEEDLEETAELSGRTESRRGLCSPETDSQTGRETGALQPSLQQNDGGKSREESVFTEQTAAEERHVTNTRSPSALTCEGVSVQLQEVTEDVFGETFLLRQALQQHHHFNLAHGVHSLRGQTPALPVHV